MSMFACLLLCFFSILASLDLGLAMLCAPRGFACMVTSFPPRVHLDVTTCEIHSVVLLHLIHTFLHFVRC